MSALAEPFVVPSNQVEAAWPDIARIVSRVTDLPWSLEDIKTELLERRAQAFGIREGNEVLGVVLTRIERTPSTTYGLIWIAAGSGLSAGMNMVRDYIEPWLFDEKGCEWIEIQGRKGWQKMMPDYEFAGITLRKRRGDH